MNIDLELYRVFCEVVKYKNITQTAEKVHISQSAITQSIQKLEKKEKHLNKKNEYYQENNKQKKDVENKILHPFLFRNYVIISANRLKYGR